MKTAIIETVPQMFQLAAAAAQGGVYRPGALSNTGLKRETWWRRLIRKPQQWRVTFLPNEAFVKTSFQSRVAVWMQECFGPEISADKMERNHRFLEEALELVQSNGCTRAEAYQLVDYVYGRPQGDINQEAGGVMVTLAALCKASQVDMHEAAETELQRISEPETMEKIRAKQAAKPRHSPLPVDNKRWDCC